jgi:hypothetical protein
MGRCVHELRSIDVLFRRNGGTVHRQDWGLGGAGPGGISDDSLVIFRTIETASAAAGIVA